mmetsp:Transcript_103366/g.126296  ORF Transcript_103366/g.126296 Transcript_103366/m.126296 type:complete len:346 (-) Transcript_103366:122-1159(-)
MMSSLKTILVFQGLGVVTFASMCGPKEPLIPGIMPGKDRPKIILAQDIDWPRYAYLGVPPESDYQVEGIGHDIAMGLEKVCDINMTVVEMKWNKCWGNAIIGKGLEHGEAHGCMAYTHTFGARNRFMEFSKPILKDNKPAGLLVRLVNGVPVVNGASNLNGLKVVDVVGWAPTADTLALAENKCTKQRFTGFTMVQPSQSSDNKNNDALKALLDGEADAMWVYADQAKNYQCAAGATDSWCTLWSGWGTTFTYIQTGLFGHAKAGTTLAMSKKGSGLAKILNPCIDQFLTTKAYYDACVKHGFTDSCFPNSHFPGGANAATPVWELPTDQQTSTCADGYCPCPQV